MPYQPEWETSGVVARVSGTMVSADLLGLVTEICQDGRFDDLLYCVVDTSRAEGFAIEENQVLVSGASLIGAAFTNARVVVTVISSRSASHAVCGTLVEMSAMPFPPVVFPDIAMARRWINAEVIYRQSLAADNDVSQFRHR
jgi:hypothetical protein